ncbi:MAG: hypothetical protein JWM11_7536, partial [Planctomycetaceae bacterium]|nr:hypothetical protein [Planctomycetaceae bacterium]
AGMLLVMSGFLRMIGQETVQRFRTPKSSLLFAYLALFKFTSETFLCEHSVER